MTSDDIKPAASSPAVGIAPASGRPRNADEPPTATLQREGARPIKLAEQFSVAGLGGSAGSLGAFE